METDKVEMRCPNCGYQFFYCLWAPPCPNCKFIRCFGCQGMVLHLPSLPDLCSTCMSKFIEPERGSPRRRREQEEEWPDERHHLPFPIHD